MIVNFLKGFVWIVTAICLMSIVVTVILYFSAVGTTYVMDYGGDSFNASLVFIGFMLLHMAVLGAMVHAYEERKYD